VHAVSALAAALDGSFCDFSCFFDRFSLSSRQQTPTNENIHSLS
jgi:hypothetical protein